MGTTMSMKMQTKAKLPTVITASTTTTTTYLHSRRLEPEKRKGLFTTTLGFGEREGRLKLTPSLAEIFAALSSTVVRVPERVATAEERCNLANTSLLKAREIKREEEEEKEEGEGGRGAGKT